MAAAGYTYSLLQILAVSIPATLIGVIAAALMSYRRGKDLADDKEFQEMIKDPEQKKYVYGENESLQGKELPSSYYHATSFSSSASSASQDPRQFPGSAPALR